MAALCTNYSMNREVRNATPLSGLHAEDGLALMCGELHQLRFRSGQVGCESSRERAIRHLHLIHAAQPTNQARICSYCFISKTNEDMHSHCNGDQYVSTAQWYGMGAQDVLIMKIPILRQFYMALLQYKGAMFQPGWLDSGRSNHRRKQQFDPFSHNLDFKSVESCNP